MTPCHSLAGRPIVAAIMFCVPELALRCSRNAESVHGETPELLPNPQTMYAASVLMVVCCDAAGTTISMVCTGPKKSCRLLGSPPWSSRAGTQVVGKTSEIPRSARRVGSSMAHVPCWTLPFPSSAGS